MFKTNIVNVPKIIACMRPALVHVIIPWMMPEWVADLKELGYSVFNLNLEDKAFPERVRTKIQRRMETGCVATYSVPMQYEDLERLMPDDFAVVWTYPNKQTEYFTLIKAGCSNPYGVKQDTMPPATEEMWKSFLAKPNDNDLMKITKLAHEWQRNQYEIWCSTNQKIMVALL
jgi:hypothetical protein